MASAIALRCHDCREEYGLFQFQHSTANKRRRNSRGYFAEKIVYYFIQIGFRSRRELIEHLAPQLMTFFNPLKYVFLQRRNIFLRTDLPKAPSTQIREADL